MYLSKTDTGTLLLTNDVPAKSRTYEVLIDSEIEKSANIPNAGALKKIVARASEQYAIPEALIYAVIEVESDGDTASESSAGAVGLMQLMPETAEDMGVEDPYDPRQNVFGGTRYLGWLLRRFDGDLDRALGAYNAGPSAVEKHNGIPPYRETQAFVQRVRTQFKRFKSEGDMVYTYRDENGVLTVTNIH
ncbi:MAG: lytic transglycosylase domain-containing protein [bacterium]